MSTSICGLGLQHVLPWSCSLCCAGDGVQELQWRLQNGEHPSGTGARLAIVLVGTNDVSLGHATVGPAVSASSFLDCDALSDATNLNAAHVHRKGPAHLSHACMTQHGYGRADACQTLPRRTF